MMLAVRSAPVLLALISAACVARDSTAGGESGTSSETGSTTDTTASTTLTTSVSTTDSASTSTTTTTTATTVADVSTADDSTSGSETFSFITAPDFDDGGPTDLPNGEDCADDGECESGFCRDAPGPGDGVCSECLMDSDCEMGTCSFEFEIGYAVCTDGAVGDGCDSDEGCAGALVCAPQFGDSGPGHCSECRADLPCDEGTVCSPVYDDSVFQGYLDCVEPQSVDLGGGCPVVDGVGDGTVCMSGACGIVTFMMGNIEVGICSECDGDDDCADGLTCQPPDAGMGGIDPGACG